VEGGEKGPGILSINLMGRDLVNTIFLVQVGALGFIAEPMTMTTKPHASG
jgi:hypothetical protein